MEITLQDFSHYFRRVCQALLLIDYRAFQFISFNHFWCSRLTSKAWNDETAPIKSFKIMEAYLNIIWCQGFLAWAIIYHRDYGAKLQKGFKLSSTLRLKLKSRQKAFLRLTQSVESSFTKLFQELCNPGWGRTTLEDNSYFPHCCF